MSKQIGILRVGVTVAASAAFVLSWSSGFLVPAMAPAEISPLALLVWRFVPLAAVLLVVVGLTRAARGVTSADVRRQALIGLFAQFGYCTAVYAAIASGVAAGTTALIDAVQPLVVAVLVGPLLGLRVRGAQWAGLLAGAVGVVLVVRSQLEGSGAHPAAYLWPAAAMACLIVGTFLQRRSASRTGTLVTLTIHVTATAAALILVAVVSGDLVPPASASFWLAAGFAAAFPTLAAYGLYWWLLRRVGITALNALLFLIAPTTAAAGALLGEPLTPVTVLGFGLCAAGVAAVLVSEAREEPTPTAMLRWPRYLRGSDAPPPSGRQFPRVRRIDERPMSDRRRCGGTAI
ncbi:DMT family transporter [Microbacterium sp. Se63.02b]|uniref:DMT family transporter n=1 Tax=Microbacterium sp. Se63.02b TaxID=2709304 RepID=UPI00160518AB|nr:DMT family transporter [Microbacterium sp. Se63.02b]QNA93525.1 DMT family transporter [Microbacterium sp. Se63.02b]